MKVELKKVQVYPRMSEETTAFNAELHVDGRKVCDVSNDGHGGSHRMYWTDRSEEAKMNAWAKTQPGWDEETLKRYPELSKSEKNLESYIDDMVDEVQEQKRIARLCKNHVVFVLKTSAPGTFYTLKTTDVSRSIENVKAKYKEQLVRIMNEELAK